MVAREMIAEDVGVVAPEMIAEVGMVAPLMMLKTWAWLARCMLA